MVASGGRHARTLPLRIPDIAPHLATGAERNEVKLKAALHYSINHPLIGAPLARLEEVERESDNSISIESSTRGGLATDLEMADAVSSGKADMGITASPIFVGKAPALAMLDLPFLFNFKALVEATAKPEGEDREADR